MSQQHISKRLFLGNRPKPYAGKPWGTRDLEAKSWQIASSVKVGLNVSYSVKIICFSLQVSTEHWVNSGYFLWEGKQSIWQSCAQWDIFRGFPPSLSPPAQHTQAIGSAVFPRSCCSALGTARPVWDGNTPWAALLSITTAWWTCLCKTTFFWRLDHPKWTQSGQWSWYILFSLLSLSFRDYFIHPPGSRCWYRGKGKVCLCSLLVHWQSSSPGTGPYQEHKTMNACSSQAFTPAEKILALAGDVKVLSNDFLSLPTPLIHVAIFLATDLNNMFRQHWKCFHLVLQ